MTKIVTSALLAGGSGKSLGAKTLGEYLAKEGYRVLLLDCDHQRTASERYDNYDTEGTTLNIFTGSAVNYVPVMENLWLVPAHSGLSSLVSELRARGTQNVYFLMERWMEAHEEEITAFDYIIIDTHPDEETITLNALVVSHLQLGFVDPDDKSTNGVVKSEMALERLKQETVQTYRIAGQKITESPVTCQLALVATNVIKSGNNQSWSPLSKKLLELVKTDERFLGVIPGHDFLKQSISEDETGNYPKIPIWEHLEDESKLTWSQLKFKHQLVQVMETIKARIDAAE